MTSSSSHPARAVMSVAILTAMFGTLSACRSVPVGSSGIVVGATSISVTDVVRKRTIPVEIYYPSHAKNDVHVEVHLGIFGLDVARDAPMTSGPHPLVVMSHGTGGTPYDLFFLAANLVARGFVVAAVRHPGDTFGDSHLLKALETWQRPQDVTAVLDALLRDAKWRRGIDDEKIAIVGHSAGGFTSLASVGARYSIDNAEKKCRTAVGDPTCDRVKGIDRASIDYTDAGNDYRDPRIKAAVALLPAVGEAADPISAGQITTPVLIIGARLDELALYDGHAAHWASLIPTSTLLTEEHGNHFQVVTPCLPLANLAVDACRDPPGFDRRRVINAHADDIFRFLSAPLAL